MNLDHRSPVWHPFTQHGLGEPVPQIVSASGAWLDCADGTRLLDLISSWWVITHGHCEPRIAAAIAAQAGQLDQIIFAGYTHPQAEMLARALVDLTPAGLDHVFFSDSGSTAVEVALKMALGHWHNRGETRHRILVMEHSYHGDTIGAMSIGARGVFNRAYEPLLFDVATVPFPAAGREQATLDALATLCAGPDRPAAFFRRRSPIRLAGPCFTPVTRRPTGCLKPHGSGFSRQNLTIAEMRWQSCGMRLSG